jgi:tryptophan synthase alpha chain
MNKLLTNKISKVFKDNKAFVAFLTAGDPSMDKTEEFILSVYRFQIPLRRGRSFRKPMNGL